MWGNILTHIVVHHTCAKFWFMGLPFLLPFLAAQKLDFSFLSFSNL